MIFLLSSKVSLSFSLSQHLKDIELLERLSLFLDCGVVRRSSNRGTAELIITKSSDLNQKVIPLLLKYNLSGVKLLDFVWSDSKRYLY